MIATVSGAASRAENLVKRNGSGRAWLAAAVQTAGLADRLSHRPSRRGPGAAAPDSSRHHGQRAARSRNPVNPVTGTGWQGPGAVAVGQAMRSQGGHRR